MEKLMMKQPTILNPRMTLAKIYCFSSTMRLWAILKANQEPKKQNMKFTKKYSREVLEENEKSTERETKKQVSQ
jgi:hypothetical protein